MIACDPVGETPLMRRCRELTPVKYMRTSEPSTSGAFRDLVAEIRPDVTFIDGDHSMKGAASDHLLVRRISRIIVHHDVKSDICWETTHF